EGQQKQHKRVSSAHGAFYVRSPSSAMPSTAEWRVLAKRWPEPRFGFEVVSTRHGLAATGSPCVVPQRTDALGGVDNLAQYFHVHQLRPLPVSPIGEAAIRKHGQSHRDRHVLGAARALQGR